MWVAAALLGGLAVVTGLLPWEVAGDVTARVAPVLVFLAAVTVVAELADDAGLFDVAAVRAARLGRGRTPLLFVLTGLLAALATTVLSLDTTAVLVTPVVLALTARLGLRAEPFALLVVWVANAGSLLLPVSNLTSLLAAGRTGLSVAGFAARTALPELATVTVSLAVLGLVHRQDLRGRYVAPDPAPPPDRALFGVAAGVCAALVPALAAGLPVAPVSAAAAAVLVGAFAVRRRDRLRPGLVPWRLLVGVEGLFLVVGALGRHGLDAALAHAAGPGAGTLGLLRTAAVGAASSNLVDNLPAYLALERVADGEPTRLLALLVGTNAGPLVTVWASLATLLWRERCRARGVTVPAGRFALLGLVGVPLLVGSATLALTVGG